MPRPRTLPHFAPSSRASPHTYLPTAVCGLAGMGSGIPHSY